MTKKEIGIFSRYSLLTPNGTGYEIFVDNNGRLIVGILTKKEYFATSVSSPFLIDKKWVQVQFALAEWINWFVFVWYFETDGIW